MLAALTLGTFTIPPDAGEKISFGKFVEICWYLHLSQAKESSLFLIKINFKHLKIAWPAFVNDLLWREAPERTDHVWLGQGIANQGKLPLLLNEELSPKI